MKADFSEDTKGMPGLMRTAKAELHLYLPEGNVDVKNTGAGANAGKPSMSDNMAAFDSGAASSGSGVTETPDIAKKQLDSELSVLKKEREQLKKIEEKVKGNENKIGGLEQLEQPELNKEKIGGDMIDNHKTNNHKTDNNMIVIFQFNPASLHISAYGGGMAPITSYGSEEGSGEGDEEKEGRGRVDYGAIKQTVTVSFKVVFDATKNEKVFPTDRVNLSPTNLAKQTAGLIRSKSYSVRPVVEGFLASVRNSSTRRVKFHWGSMQYGGFLNKAQCRYTMFDIEGEAVRAEVELSLVCSCHKDYNDRDKWKDSYDNYMKKRQSEFRLQGKAWKAFFRATVGRTEKACILFHKELRYPEEGEKDVSKEEEILGLSTMAETISRKAQKGKVKKRVGDEGKTDAAEQGRTKIKSVSVGEKVKGEDYVPVWVHYNPASITLYSRGGETVTREGSQADPMATARFQRNAMSAETVLSMELFFDETDNANAFMLDTGMSSPTGLARAGVNMASRAKNGQCSVASVSELFVAATASAYNRQVCFVWNKMVFWGELSEVEVEYTMFNNRGEPIRSKVSIRIRQDKYSEKVSPYEKVWQNAYYELPKAAEELGSDKSVTSSSWNHIASNLFHM